MGEALARPVFSLLNGPQAPLASRTGEAWSIDPRYGPFAAALDRGEAAQAGLAEIVREAAGEVWLVEEQEWPAPPGCETVRTAPLVQMVAPLDGPCAEPDPEIEALGDADVPAMTDLALATQPGPWGEFTHRYGQFFGIRVKGQKGERLAAMAGERMRPAPGFAEVSGVCTWPEYRGRGLARRLITHVMAAQRARGEVPFLHSYAHNAGAIGLYESLGFAITRNMVVTVLRGA